MKWDKGNNPYQKTGKTQPKCFEIYNNLINDGKKIVENSTIYLKQ